MRLALLFIMALLAGCSAVLPLGDEYTFDDTDASVRDLGLVDATMDGDDAGPVCDTIPTEAEACADRCGDVELCDMIFTCGGCDGELSCGGAGTANVCGCATAPCAVASVRAGDVDRQVIVGVAVDSDGNVFIAGDFRGTITIGDDVYTNPGTSRMDIFLAKLDPTGTPLWSRAYGAIGDATGDDAQNAHALAVDAAGNVVLAGYSYSPINLGGDDLPAAGDIIIVKLDGDGGHIFSDTYGSESGIRPMALDIDPASQDIFLTGRFYGTLQFGSLSAMTAATPGGNFDIFVVIFNPAGTPLRSKRFGDAAEQTPESIAVSGGHFFLSAYFNGNFDFGPVNPMPLSTTTSYSLAVTKLDTTFFSHQWSRQYGTEVSESRLAADSTGGVFLSGRFSGSLDITSPALDSADGDAFLAQLDADGNTVWASQLANVWISNLDAGPDGTLYVVGQANGAVDLGGGTVPASGSRDAFIAHYAADGTHLWSRVFAGATGDQAGVDVAVSPDGTAWLAAQLEGQADFGDGTITSNGDTDAVVVGYVP